MTGGCNSKSKKEWAMAIPGTGWEPENHWQRLAGKGKPTHQTKTEDD